ncbi:TolC family protein [Klebsiella oxytoca]|uniref:TolC family protein n=1 Tax=Klebsiella oxytoca TaxID=571 RepID=UPI00157A2C92|nr:TolC family protein [Klebsiella oxytoca]
MLPLAALCISPELLLLSGCTTDSLDRAPVSASAPWSPDPQSRPAPGARFTIPANPIVAEVTPPPAISETHHYQLSELIDMAQMNNPDTRIAWQQARQAALAVGMAEATFLPIISASVLGGYQKTHTPLPYDTSLNTTDSAIIPGVALQWLVFDFGQRSALVDAAKNNAFAANISFNGIHQKLIYDVTRAYYQYGAALSRVGIAKSALHNSEQILAAVQSRRQSGIATTVEVAQVTQLVAQARLNRVISQGAEREAWQNLLGAMGISPSTRFTISYSTDQSLPPPRSEPGEAMIKMALARRPDILASYAALQAAHSGIDAAEADFLPKVYLAGAIAGGNGRFDVQGLPAIGSQTSSSNILIGISVPIYDGGVRTARVQEAQSRATAAGETLKKTQDLAVREIVVSASTLRSALESNDAALSLVSTAIVTYDAALEAYRNGVGTVTDANAAANGLLAAQQMSTDAHAAALIAAANLAFVMGEMTQAPANDVSSG